MDETKRNDNRPMPRGFISMGRRKPFMSSGTSKSVAIVLPKDVLEDVGYDEGDIVELFRNKHNDLLIRFLKK